MMALQQEARLLNPSGNQPKWTTVFKVHWLDYVTLAVLATLWLIMEDMHPFTRILYFKSDVQMWRYSFPLRPNTVPAVAVLAVAFGGVAVSASAALGPGLVFLVYHVAFRCSRVEFHNLVLVLFTNVMAVAAVTNFIKLNVGRPRPDFMARCWPSVEPKFDSNGLPDCVDGIHRVAEGLKSFPSGHTAVSASGLGFLGFFLLGKWKAFDGSAHPIRIVAGLLPMFFALWIGLTRIQDYWHHWEDVAAGYVLGISGAYCFYRSLYPPLTSSRADMPSTEYHARHSDASGKAYTVDPRTRDKRTVPPYPDSTTANSSRNRMDAPEITEAAPLISTNV